MQELASLRFAGSQRKVHSINHNAALVQVGRPRQHEFLLRISEHRQHEFVGVLRSLAAEINVPVCSE